MRINKFLMLLLLSSLAVSLQAHIPDYVKNAGKHKTAYRAECQASRSAIDQEINNVRARLLGGGDCWWDFNDGRYIVPKVEPGSGKPEVSSIFAGSVWLGGVDPGGNLKLACQDYRPSGQNDFWPGPLSVDGITDDASCLQWDKHFRVTGTEIRQHIFRFNSGAYSADLIPKALRRWPAAGNPYFLEEYGFSLPSTPQGLAGFNDVNFDGVYDPLDGDYPAIEIRKCPLDQYPDEMIFWIYNDQGGGAAHARTGGAAIQMEVQVQAFGYVTLDDLNNMTFQRYKLINRAVEDIDSCFFAMWVDADLGCYSDDYIGCDSSKSLMYVYNQDPVDGQPGCDCPGGVPTYCNDVPLMGVDYFRGPRDTLGNELGMSSFMYYNNPSVGNPDPNTTDPDQPIEFYHYLNGRWKNGTELTFGGSGFGSNGAVVRYALPNIPSDPLGWSMCTANLPFGDRRTLQATGPFLLKPSAVNELIIGVPWVPVGEYNCPNMDALFRADKLAQGLFDNCFNIQDGPDAPTVDWIELDKEVIAVISNNNPASNNCNEQYGQGPVIPSNTKVEIDILAPDDIADADKVFNFEGYEIYQLINADVSPADFDDTDRARLVQVVDVKNGIKSIFNWKESGNPVEIDTITGDELVYSPELRVQGNDSGIRHTFSIKEDRFATGNDKALINHKKYFYAVIAYAHNEYQPFDPLIRPVVGQQAPYLRGRRGDQGNEVTKHTIIPRPIVDRKLNSKYGDGVVVTRIEGEGTGNNFLRLTEDSRNASFNGTSNGELTYEQGSGPINVAIFNPFEVKNGTYELRISDATPGNGSIDDATSFWSLVRTAPLGDNPILSDRSLAELNEQIVAKYGFSVTIAQVEEPGTDPRGNDNGAVGAEIVYKKGDYPWLGGYPDTDPGEQFGVFDFVRTEALSPDEDFDPQQKLSSLGDGFFVPYYLTNWRLGLIPQPQFMMTPAWTEATNNFNLIAMGNSAQRTAGLASLRNVDIVFTNDKSKWSRCVVIETASYYYSAQPTQYPQNPDLTTEGITPDATKSFDLRYGLSVGKEADANGLPVPDGEMDGTQPKRGMGWFPGYAIDVETGERLNVFFGENSCYSKDVNPNYTGRDMMFNPTDQIFLDGYNQNTIPAYYDLLMGGQHFVYVTDEVYDGCENIYKILKSPSAAAKRPAIKLMNWAGMLQANQGFKMNSYAQGLIPDDVRVSLRVKNSYKEKDNTAAANTTAEPLYRFKIEGREAADLEASAYDAVLDSIKAVPNPYYGYAQYETTKFTNTVKITNLPAKCTVTIYTIDGKFIRQFQRDESYSAYNQIMPDLEWDLQNSRSVPVASGVYLINVQAPGIGERTIKWFGINRKFDPSGL